MKDWSPNNSRQIMDKTGTLVLCLGEAFVGSILAHEKNLKYFQIKFLFGCIIRRNSNIVGESCPEFGGIEILYSNSASRGGISKILHIFSLSAFNKKTFKSS